MKDSDKPVPLEKKVLEVEIDGTTKKVPALDKRWVELKKRNFNRYLCHPVPVGGGFILGEKETWLELTGFVIEDLEWLLQQRHHIFWSHMIYSKDAQQLLITFLQEAPPYYLRSEFPKDEDMERALERIERLVFVVFVRLSTERESESCFVQNLGELLYENYIFTVPILLDICLIYGIRNRHLVAEMFDNVIAAAPQYLNDFKEVVPHFVHVLSIVRDKFDNNSLSMVNDRSVSRFREIRDLILHLYDSTANIHIFLEIYSNGSKLFRTDSFASEVVSFYSYVIPKIYNFVKKNDCDTLRSWNFLEKINGIRLDLLSIIRNVLCGIVNDVLNDSQRQVEYANEYLTKVMEILQEPLFLSDYNRLYPVGADLRLLREMCLDMDSENLRYISEAIAPFDNAENASSPPPGTAFTGVELESLITEVKDIFPHLGDGFIEACIQHYNYNTERVISGILENKLPPDIDTMSRTLKRDELPMVQAIQTPQPSQPKREKTKPKHQETLDLLNDKSELNEMRDRFSQLTLVPVDDYNDEYDDTYDDRELPIQDDADRERRPFVKPRILRTKEDEEESEDEEDENEAEGEGKKEESASRLDHFVPNPAEIRAKQEQRRMERARRDCVGRGKGHGQDKQVLANRDFKGTHKSFIGNHNRRKLASRKRNMPMVNS